MAATVYGIHNDLPDDAPGIEYSPWRYCLALAQGGFVGALGPGPFAVLNYLGWRGDKQRHVWMSITTMASELGISERQAQYHLRSLEGCGAIARKERNNPNGSQTSNLYVLFALEDIHPIRPVRTPKPKVAPGAKDCTPPVQEPAPPPVQWIAPKRTNSERTKVNMPISVAPAEESAMPDVANGPWALAEQAASLLHVDLSDPMNQRLKGRWLKHYKALLDKGKSIDDLMACQAWELSGYGLHYHLEESGRPYSPACLEDAWALWSQRRPTAKPAERGGKPKAEPQFTSGFGKTHKRSAAPDFVCPDDGCNKVLGSPHKERCRFSGRVTGEERL